MNKKLKNTVFKGVEIEGIAAEGKCVARVNNQVIFVEKVAPGDVVDLKIVRKRKSFLEATPLVISKLSEKRSDPFCEHFGTCGGCKWQHIKYEAQLKYKRQQVIDSLERIAKVKLPEIEPILSSPKEKYYRNKLEFTFSNRRWLTHEEIRSDENISKDGVGFHIPGRFDKIIDVNHCYLQENISNKIRLTAKAFAKKNHYTFFDIIKQNGLLRNLIIKTSNLGEVMVILLVAEDDPEKIMALLDHLKQKFAEITSLNYVINTKKNDTFNDLDVINFSGLPFITEQMEELKFRIGPKSFFQTNSDQALELFKLVKKYAAPNENEIIYDLYTGTGTIANFVAKKAKKVIGLEYVADAIKDAKINSSINNIENTNFYAGDIKDLLNDDLLSEHGKPDIIITDPPRAGMHESVVQMLLQIEAKKIVYVSCNPATQARDISILDEKYEITAIQPVDMFPHTHHVECVVVLELKGLMRNL